jgi:hypothetical protein
MGFDLDGLLPVETPVACISSAAMANDPPTSTMVERRPPWQPPKRFYEVFHYFSWKKSPLATFEEPGSNIFLKSKRYLR